MERIAFREPDGQRPDDIREDQPVALIVDDEPFVLLLLSMILTTRGWRVIQASDGDDALARTEGMDLGLVVTDYNMPGMDGATLATRLIERDPNLPVLVISGQPRVDNWVEGPRSSFLAKPFAIKDLACRVESLTGCATGYSGQTQSARC